MAEHWCKEHKQPFFKKGNMKGFAHPILDDDGEPTGDWCNEPKKEQSEGAKTGISGEERGMWWKEIGELIRSEKLEEVFGEKDAPIIKRAYKLQAIASLGITAKKEE